MSKPTRSEHAELTAALEKVRDAISKGWVEHRYADDWFRSTALGNIRIIPPEITVAEAVEAVGSVMNYMEINASDVTRRVHLASELEILREWAVQEQAKGVGK